MKIVLTEQESEEYFYNSLCNSLGYLEGYGLSLFYDSTEYKEAKSKLNNPCFEDVLMQILKDGGTLHLKDIEGEGEMDSSITLQDVHERVSITPFKHLSDMMSENDDAETGDVILQTVFFRELVFG
jgi:hypothetical protein